MRSRGRKFEQVSSSKYKSKISAQKNESRLHIIKRKIGNFVERVYLEKFLVVSIFILFTMGFFRGLKSRWILQNADAAGFVDAFRYRDLGEYSSFAYGSSGFQLQEVINSGPGSFSPVSLKNTDPDFNVFNSHAYLLTYLIRFLSPLFNSPETLPLLLLAVSYAIGISTLVLLGLHLKVEITSLYVGLLILFSSPIFYMSLLGQPYMDRLFFGPCIILMYMTHRKVFDRPIGLFIFISLFICTSLISERASLLIGIIVLLQILFHVRNTKQIDLRVFVISFLCLISISWYFLWTKIYLKSPYSDNLGLENITSNLIALISGNRQQNFITLIICLIPFIFIGFFRFQYLLIAFSALLPNLIFSIGGAELSGFATHYHALYLPPFAFMLFTASRSSKAKLVLIKSLQKFSIVASVIFSVSLGFTYVGDKGRGDFQIGNLNLVKRDIVNAFGMPPEDLEVAQKIMSQERVSLMEEAAIQSTISVSSPEGVMPALIGQEIKKIDYFPMGLGYSHIVFVPFTDNSYREVEISLYGFVPKDDRKAWSDHLLKILDLKYELKIQHSGQLGYMGVYELVNKS
jgi:hypothetical protein